MSSPALTSPRKVNFTIDIDSNDFQIESLTLTFGQTDNCPRDALPKLLEWIKPNYRPVNPMILGLCALSSNVFHVCVKSCPSGGFLGEGTVRHGGRCSSTGHNPTPTPLPAAIYARTDFGLSLILDILANFEQFTRLQAINHGCYTCHRIVDHCCVCV